MLDIKLFRDDPELLKKQLAVRAVDPALIDQVCDLDVRRRLHQKAIDDLRADQKRAGKDVARLRGDDKERLLDELKEISDQIAERENEMLASADDLRALLLVIPNVPHPDLPAGDESANVELRTVGEPTSFDFAPRDHLDIGETLGLIDMESGAKVAGSRFTFLKGAAVILWFAVKQLAIETLQRHGHTPVLPPVLVRREAMEGTGIFPAGEDQI